MILSPKELPELRRSMYTDRRSTVWTWDVMQGLHDGLVEQGGGGPESLYSWFERANASIKFADLNFVDVEFAELIGVAAPSMPVSTVSPSDVPSQDGLIYFASPLLDQRSGVAGHWIVAWGVCDEGIEVWWYADKDTKMRQMVDNNEIPGPLPSAEMQQRILESFPPFVLSFAGLIRYGAESTDITSAAPGSMEWFLGYLLATWHLQRQRLTVERRVMPDRPARRRLDKAGDTTPREVRVINLRGADPALRGTAGGREYRNRWMVRGHWRQQWYPSIQDNRPVWIAPYIKGPEGAPVLGGEKVYAWNR